MRLLALWVIAISALLSFLDYRHRLEELQERTQSYADFVAYDCAISLAFANDQYVSDTLQELCGHPPFVAAGVYRRRGGWELVSYNERTPGTEYEPLNWPVVDEAPQGGFDDGRFVATSEMRVWDSMEGTLFLTADLASLRESAVTNFVLMALCGLLCLSLGSTGDKASDRSA